jgi:ABC-type glycerol-3-phosphate transport system substrate-binding protein
VVKVVPETWNDLLAAAPKLSRIGNPPTAYGLAFAGKAGEELPKVFYPMLWSHGGFIIDNDGKVGLDTPGAIAAAELLRKFATSGAMPPDLQTWDVGKILDELQRGTLAISAPQWNALFPLIRAGSSTLRNHIQIAKLPGVRQPDGQVKRVNFRQTWTLVKSAGGKNQELANDFILYATGKDGARLYAQAAQGNPARTSVLTDPELQRLRPEFALLLDSLKISKAEPEVVFYAQMHRVMNEMLSSILGGTRAPADAMRDAATKVRGLRKVGS